MASQATVTPITPQPQRKPKPAGFAAAIAVEKKVHHERAPFTQGAKHVALYLAARLAWDDERGEFNAFVMEKTIAAAVGDRGNPKSVRQVSRWVQELVAPGPWQVFRRTPARGPGYESHVTRGMKHRCNRYALICSVQAINVARAMRLKGDIVALAGVMTMASPSTFGGYGSDARGREFWSRDLALQQRLLRGELSEADYHAAVERLRHEHAGVIPFPAQ